MGVGENGRPIVQRVARQLAAENHQWLVFPRGKLFLGRPISNGRRPAARLPLPFPRRRLFAFSSRSVARSRASLFSTNRNLRCRPRDRSRSLKLMRRMEDIGHCQIIMATHSPMLMAYPNATLLRLSKYGLEPVTVKETDHYKVMREFCEDPKGFVDAAIAE